MKIMIMSDTHGENKYAIEAIMKEPQIDLLIHCGDIDHAESVIKAVCNCPVVIVKGNNDFQSNLKNEEELEIGNYSVLVTHGHRYSVSIDRDLLKEEARDRCIDLVFYGHTHRPEIDVEGDVTVVNPGSISLPRQEDGRKSYCMMEVDGDDVPVYEIRYI